MKSIRKAYNPDLVVLIVEDYLLFAREIKHALPRHTVVFARSMEEAKLRYEECLPDITFLDIDLPDGNGFDLIDHIRNRDPGAYVVMLTGSKLKEDVARADAKGAQGYIIKPFTKEKINQIIEDYLRIRENNIKSALQKTEEHRRQPSVSLATDTTASIGKNLA